MINDIVDYVFCWGGVLCRNYALQEEEIGMLIMCEPLVWFCIIKKTKTNLYQKFSNKNAAWCQLDNWVLKFMYECEHTNYE